MKSISSGITSARTPSKSDSLGGRRQKPDGGPDQLCKTADGELLPQLRANVDDGLVADVELLGDAAIGLALRQQSQRLQLPRRQLREPILTRGRVHQGHLHGEISMQIRCAGSDLLKGLYQFGRRGVLEHI